MGEKEIKYLIKPGFVISENDGDKHFINSSQLMSLYRVKQSECLFYSKDMPKDMYEGLVVLEPQFDGNYSIDRCQTYNQKLEG